MKPPCCPPDLAGRVTRTMDRASLHRAPARRMPSTSEWALTSHARRRMVARGIPASAVDAALCYGRLLLTRGAEVWVIGRGEIAGWAAEGIDLSRYEGIQVVCSTAGRILTVYRNRRASARRLSRRGRRG